MDIIEEKIKKSLTTSLINIHENEVVKKIIVSMDYEEKACPITKDELLAICKIFERIEKKIKK